LRFQKSLTLWAKQQKAVSLPEEGSLIAVVDALWFKTKHHRPQYGCFSILLRPINSERAQLAAMVLLPGKESKVYWRQVFQTLPPSVQKRIVAVVADGFTGLMGLADEYGWHFQWCQVHMLRKMLELRGFRNLPGKEIRQRVLLLMREFMETPDEAYAKVCHSRLSKIFLSPECPRSIVTRLSGLIKRGHLLRTCFTVPEYNLPTSTNSVERVNAFIRERFALMRGVNREEALRFWLDILKKQIGSINCRGYKETFQKSREKKEKKNHRKSLS
jgi:transposase-like protein